MRPVVYRSVGGCLLVLMQGALLVQASRPAPQAIFVVPDWALHLAAYAVLGLLAALALYPTGKQHPSRQALKAFFIVGATGLLDEFVQHLSGIRDPSLIDFACDLLGGSLSVSSVYAWLYPED